MNRLWSAVTCYRFPKLRQVVALQRAAHCARATRAAKLSAEVSERQNCGELIADEAETDETEKAERITASFAEANSKRRSQVRTSEPSSLISGTLSLPTSDAFGKKIGRNSPRITCHW